MNHITTINGVEIFAEVTSDGNIFVPIKPICTALGIADNKQREKIQEDDILASVGTLRVSTGADGKQYEMYCLPLEYVYGWLFTINPKNVADSARETVKNYRRECYEALYNHFSRSLKRQIKENEAEIELLQKINSAIADEKDARIRRKKAEEALDKLRSERLNPQPTLFP
ncbi:phage antirepressor N-terminal domain-containing protein [uncultured Duncaniella sp.]|uniref:phage antirepressor N-terminal domain-containing protein n=1 Tax=uncultured Duncaniella sp. TaxID=2768039 RepID=UPI0026032D58|nr:phage antirepressor N-terminal domain-containing protein [uncultured Duncaniella sp.]